jgi:hypothetical protein
MAYLSPDLPALDIGIHRIEPALLLFEPGSLKFVGIVGEMRKLFGQCGVLEERD